MHYTSVQLMVTPLLLMPCFLLLHMAFFLENHATRERFGDASSDAVGLGLFAAAGSV